MILSIVVDISTDVLSKSAPTYKNDTHLDPLVVSIPARFLWRIQISPRQKLALSAVLCLSIFMILTVVITTLHLADVGWIMFWSTAEACLGVILASMSAIRILLVSGGLNRLNKPKQNQRDEADLNNGLNREDILDLNLPAIPAPAPTLPLLDFSSPRFSYLCDHPRSTSQEAILPQEIPEASRTQELYTQNKRNNIRDFD